MIVPQQNVQKLITKINGSNFSFIIFSLLTLISGLIVQLLLPMILPSAFDHGLMIILKDPVKFHNLAIDVARAVESGGWAAFQLTPEYQFPAGLLGAIYYITGTYSPLLQIPINAIFTGLSAHLIWKIFHIYIIKEKYRYLLIFILLFTPSSMTWNTQILKDGYLVFAVLAVFVGIMGVLKEKKLQNLIWFFIGCLFIVLIKDYWTEIFFIGCIPAFAIIFLNKDYRKPIFIFMAIITTLTFLLGSKTGRRYYSEIPRKAIFNYITDNLPLDKKIDDPKYFNYQSQFPPLDVLLQRLSYGRFKFLYEYGHAGENYRYDLKVEYTT